MEYIATAALVVIAGCAVWFTRAVVEFIKRFRLGPSYVAGNLNIKLSQEDRDLLAEAATNYRRNKPRTKKETV